MSINAMMEDIPLLPMQQDLSLVSVINNIEETKKSIAQLPCITFNRKRKQHVLEKELSRLQGLKLDFEKQSSLSNNQQNNTIDKQWICIKNNAVGIWADNKITGNLHSFTSAVSTQIADGITVIDVSNNKLEYLPLNHIIRYARNVTKVNASHNNIAAISYRSDESPYKIIGHYELKKLNMSYNQLTSFDFDTQFYATPYIEDIDLSHNPLEHCIWQDSSEWTDELKRLFINEHYPRIDIRHTKISKELVDTLKKQYMQKNIQSYATKACHIGTWTSIVPIIGSAVGMSLNIDTVIAMGIHPAAYPGILMVL
jgi:hypothetical protein